MPRTTLDCTIETRQGGFAVYQKAPMVQTTRPAQPGDENNPNVKPAAIPGYVVESQPVSQVFKGYRPSVFTAYYKGDDVWDTDEDAGAQRYETTRTTREIRKALKVCGFDKDTINQTIKQAKKP